MENGTKDIAPRFSRRDVLRYLGYGSTIAIGTALGATACSSAGSPSGSGAPSATSGSTTSSGGANPSIAHLTFARENTLGTGLDPGTNGGIVGSNVLWYFYEALYTGGIAQPTTFIPQLAAATPTKVDDVTYTVQLRSGAVWHDGTPVTGDDVVYSFERVISLGTKTPLQRYMTNFDSVSASGDTVTLKLKKPSALLVQRLSCVKIVSKAYLTGPEAKDAIGFKPIGSGPYKVTSVSPNGVELTKFDGYSGPFKHALPAQAISIKIITDANARLAAVQSGSIDATLNISTNAIEQLTSNGLTVKELSSYVTHLLFVNGFKEPFKDPRVLQSVMYAMDREAIVQAAYNGHADIADAFIPPTSADYTQPTTVHTHDVAKAKQLLADAGFPNGISFELQVPTNDPTYAAAGQLMQQQCKEAGINITLRPGDSAGLFARVANGSFQAMYTQSSPAAIGSADAHFIYSWSYSNGANLAGAPLWKGAQQEQIETLLGQAAVAPTDAEYKSTMAQVIEMVAQYGPAQAVVHPKVITAWDKAVGDSITPSPVGFLILGKGL